MIRHTLYKQITTDDENNKIYHMNVPWGKFPFNEGYRKHFITEVEKMRPWLISIQYYNTPKYRDVIFFINNVQDTFNIPDGYELRIPIQHELEKWIADNKN